MPCFCKIPVRMQWPWKKKLLRLSFDITFDIRSAQEWSLPGEGAPRSPPASPLSWRGGCRLSVSAVREAPALESQARYNWEAGSASHPRGTLQGPVGASAGMEHPGSSTPLLCLHPFPASVPTRSLCCFPWAWVSLLALMVGRRPCSCTLTDVWPRLHLALAHVAL